MSVTTTPHVNFRGQARDALQGTAGDEIQPLWDALAKSASKILIPLAPAPFAPLYGMLTDRYGVTWIVGADTAPDAD